jgi:hypothetical protein
MGRSVPSDAAATREIRSDAGPGLGTDAHSGRHAVAPSGLGRRTRLQAAIYPGVA